MTEKLILSTTPHIHSSRTVRGAMLHVVLALLPAVFCSLYFFGLPALSVLCVSVAVCVFTEWFITRYMLRRPSTVGDFSAVLTGILLALNLPANLPLWMVAAGAVMALGIGKMAFGGLGCNIFNPALVGRVFLLISFPVAMTCWPLPEAGFGDADGATGATVLSLVKLGQLNPSLLPESYMLWGSMGGSMGEVSALALLAGFVYLLFLRVIKWQIPVAVVAGLAIVDVLAGYPVLYDIFSGGLLLGAIFMATDYVTSPMTRRGMIVYGLFIGIITAAIRRWGAYPEGMSFAILIMNGFTPLINRYMKPHRFSPKKKKEALA
ncbi:MAG: RnfABCDGE type electron transport complex subunit D [Muribaculaceae bacterium]|nr:RnfABCDGE type electron transport complex subunit D [Muribaculaceae bacterium]